jgi:hypothetical protein
MINMKNIKKLKDNSEKKINEIKSHLSFSDIVNIITLEENKNDKVKSIYKLLSDFDLSDLQGLDKNKKETSREDIEMLKKLLEILQIMLDKAIENNDLVEVMKIKELINGIKIAIANYWEKAKRKEIKIQESNSLELKLNH